MSVTILTQQTESGQKIVIEVQRTPIDYSRFVGIMWLLAGGLVAGFFLLLATIFHG